MNLSAHSTITSIRPGRGPTPVSFNPLTNTSPVFASTGVAAATTNITVSAHLLNSSDGTLSDETETTLFTIQPRLLAPMAYPQGPFELVAIPGVINAADPNNLTMEFGAFSQETINFGTDQIGTGPIPVTTVTSGPDEGLMFLAATPPLKRPAVKTNEALYGIGAWYADQEGIDNGSTTSPAGLPYCVGADITGPLQQFVTRHEGMTQATNSHFGIDQAQFVARNLASDFEGLVVLSALGSRTYRTFMELVLNNFTVAVNPMHIAFDQAEYGGPTLPNVQQTIGCSFDMTPFNAD